MKIKVVTKEAYDSAEEAMNEARDKYKEKISIKTLSGKVRLAKKWSDIDIKYEKELTYLQSNKIYDDLFDSNGNIDSESMKFWTQELNVSKNKDLWVLLARAEYLTKKSYFESLTIEEENSSTKKSSIEDYNTSSDCSEEDLKDLKSNKGK